MPVGIDIGGTKIAAVLVAPDGTVAKSAETPTPQGPRAVLDAAAALAMPLLGSAPKDAVGVGTAGTVDPRDGSIRYATDSIPGWTGTRVAGELAARLGRPVVVDNDVNAAALGESWAGAGRGHRDLLLVAIGTGLGAGLIRGGRIERGSRGAAGEIAHLPTPGAEHLRCGCGRFGHLESLASGTGLANAYRLASPHSPHSAPSGQEAVSGRGVAALAAQGDPVAREVVAAAGTALGRALAGLVALLDPAVVVLAGGASPSLLDSVQTAYEDELLPAWAHVPLLPATLGPAAVAVGAARLAWEAS
ncbi:MAG TPA: ROK family protein [Candidatus Limnocylindrales bacterium]